MSKKEFFYCKDVIRFSLKNATKPISTIRLRMNLHGERHSICLSSTRYSPDIGTRKWGVP